MRVGILLLVITLYVTSLFSQKDVNILDLDMNHGLLFVPNTMKPYSGTAKEDFSDGKKKMRLPIKNGKIHGTVKEWAKNGEKIFEGKYVDGLSNGKEMQWYASGQKKLEVNYLNGEVHGVCVEWFKNGKKKSEGYFETGLESGEHHWWYQNGSKDQFIPYENGKANGLVKHWHQDGQLKLESAYQDGVQHGPATEWHASGQKILESNYDTGKEHGVFKFWSKSGLLLGKQVFDHGVLKEDLNYRSGNVNVSGGYVQVFNTTESYFKVPIKGTKVIPMKSLDMIYVVDQKYLQLFNYGIQKYFGEQISTSTDQDLLNKFLEKETVAIKESTGVDIQVKSEMLKTGSGQSYIYWHFDSPSSKVEEQTDRTVLEEHYISMICDKDILSLYSLITRKDQPAENVRLLKKTAEQVTIEKERIDLNAVAK